MNADSLLPEFLSVEQLKSHLQQFIEPHQLPNDKSRLVELAYRFIVPLPQRHFRSNRLGTLLSQSQQPRRGEKRARSPESQSTERASKMQVIEPIDVIL